MGGLLQRMFGFGDLPAAMTEALRDGEPLLDARGISVKASGKLTSPQRRSSGFTKLHRGTLVVVPGRVLACFGRYLVVDDRIGEPTSGAGTTCTSCSIDGAGLRVAIDVARLIPGGTGHVDLEFRTAVPDAALGALAVRSWSGGVAAEDPARLLMRV